jgi:predicted nucleic acid-binding protein
VVVDTNVVVAAAFKPRSHSARVLAAVREGTLRMAWSDETRAETERVVGRIPVLSTRALEGLFLDRDRHVPADDPGAFDFVPDPEDRKFARLAAAAGATLVTMDEHLLGVRERAGVPILTPGELFAGDGGRLPRPEP